MQNLFILWYTSLDEKNLWNRICSISKLSKSRHPTVNKKLHVLTLQGVKKQKGSYINVFPSKPTENNLEITVFILNQAQMNKVA